MTSTGRLCLASALVVVAAGSHAFARPLYPQPLKWVLSDATGLAVADVNNDGYDDVVIPGRDFHEVRVHLGNGDGTFTTLPDHISDDCPMYAALADFDSNGNLDLALAKYGNCSTGDGYGISILMGNGDGTFAQETDYDTGQQLFSVTIGDFNGDDVADVLGMGGDGQLLLGNGDGTFTSFAVEGSIYFAGVADFDGDGLDDYAYPRGGPGLAEVQLSNGDGTFDFAGTFPVGDNPQAITAGDVSEDSIPDLVVANAASNDISILLGNGDGTFGAEQRHSLGVPAEPVLEPWYVLIDDLDGDGLQDIVVASWLTAFPSPSIALFYGTGGGAFSPAVHADMMSGFSHGVALSDFDGDGAKDLVRTCLPCSYVSWLFGDGRGAFITNLQQGVGRAPTDVGAGDFDGNDRLDLVTLNQDSDDVSVMLADGAGSFAPEQRSCVVDALPPCPPGSDPAALAIGELTGDAHADFAVANLTTNTVSVLAGDGAGSFSFVSSLTPFAGMSPSSIAIGDLDKDDDEDLLVVGEGSPRLGVFLGNGDGTFDAPPGLPTGVGNSPTAVVAGRIDGDDYLDVAVANAGSSYVTVLLGDGDGTFTAAADVATPLGLSDVAVGDLDGDQILDLVAADSVSQSLYVFLGVGDGSFGPLTVIDDSPDSSFGTYSVQIADLDGDALPDLVRMRGAHSVFPGNGDGTFDPPQHYASGGDRFAVGDLNLDRRLDLVGFRGSGVNDSIIILLNQSGPRMLTFEPDQVTLVWPAVTGALSYDVYRGDMPDLVDGDDDGLPDGGYGSCMTSLDDDPRDTFFEDAEVPSSSGAGFFYLIDVLQAGGYSGVGTTSGGLVRTPQAPCP